MEARAVMFQFLLVQLRQPAPCRCQLVGRVSIPLGAIKTKDGHSAGANKGKFQFLLVQLRHECRADSGCHCSRFQFLLVQLRRPAKGVKTEKDLLFQFLLVQLRRRFFCIFTGKKAQFQFLLVQLRRIRMGHIGLRGIRFNSSWCN